MKLNLFNRITRAFHREETLHPVECRMAKHWIKQRLAKVFPELRCDPRGLEAAYQALNLAPRPGSEAGEPDTVFELKGPYD